MPLLTNETRLTTCWTLSSDTPQVRNCMLLLRSQRGSLRIRATWSLKTITDALSSATLWFFHATAADVQKRKRLVRRSVSSTALAMSPSPSPSSTSPRTRPSRAIHCIGIMSTSTVCSPDFSNEPDHDRKNSVIHSVFLFHSSGLEKIQPFSQI